MKPRERLQAFGPHVLEDRELLELLLSPGTSRYPSWYVAERLMETFGDLYTLSALHPNELAMIPGVGMAKAGRIVAGIELGRRLLGRTHEGESLRNPSKVYEVMRDLVILGDEYCYMLTLDVKARLKTRILLAKGGEASCHLEPRVVFKQLMKLGDTRFILVHNHPSGDFTPSPQDLAITRRLLWGAHLLEVEFLDHIVVARGGYASIRTEHPALWDHN